MEYINMIIENWDQIVTVVLAVIGAAAAIAAVTPTPKDDKIVGKIQKVFKLIVDTVGMNVGKARNEIITSNPGKQIK